MARRSRDWNAGLTEDLRKPQFAREFLLAAADEGVPLHVAIAKVARALAADRQAKRTARGVNRKS